MANKKTKGKNENNLKGLIVVAVILIALIIMVSLHGNKKDYSKENIDSNILKGSVSENGLFIGEIEIGNTTVIKAKLFLYNADKIPTIKSGDTINLLTNGQLDFKGKVSIVGDKITEIKPGGAASGVLIQLDSLVNLSIGEEINIMDGDFQIGTLVVEEIM